MMVLDQDRKDALLQSIADAFAREIILSTMSRAKTIHEISQEHSIPISTCYRRVHELISLRLLRVEKTVITESGKRFETFRSTVKDATINFSPGELSVEVTLISREPEQKLSAMWKSIRGDDKLQLVSPVG